MESITTTAVVTTPAKSSKGRTIVKPLTEEQKAAKAAKAAETAAAKAATAFVLIGTLATFFANTVKSGGYHRGRFVVGEGGKVTPNPESDYVAVFSKRLNPASTANRAIVTVARQGMVANKTAEILGRKFVADGAIIGGKKVAMPAVMAGAGDTIQQYCFAAVVLNRLQ